MKRVGIAPRDVLRWATRNGAVLAGRESELGALAAGALADLLVIEGDPTQDVSILARSERLAGVMKGGRWIEAPPPAREARR